MKYLLTGKNGYVGKKFSLTPNLKNDLIVIGRNFFDYYDRKLLAEFIKQNLVTHVINAAGFT